MQVLAYAHYRHSSHAKLSRILQTVPGAEVEFHHDHEGFKGALRREIAGRRLVVFLASDRDDLHFLGGVKELLDDIRLVTILPDREVETIRLGHRLYPRYQTFADTDFSDLKAVLAKMAGSGPSS